jgi:hypothetical protein
MPLSFMGSVQVATADLEDENKALKEALEKSRGSANAATIRLERDLREATGKVLLLIHHPPPLLRPLLDLLHYCLPTPLLTLELMVIAQVSKMDGEVKRSELLEEQLRGQIKSQDTTIHELQVSPRATFPFV